MDLHLTDRPVNVIAEGFDLAIRIGPVREANLVVKRLGRASGVVCASPAYLAERGTPRAPADLARHACIVFDAPPHGAAWTFTAPSGDETVQVDGRLVVNSLSVARDAAIAGLGVARLPSFVCAADLAADRLRRVLVPFSPGERPVMAVLPSGRHMSPKVRAFLDFVAERLSNVRGLGAPFARSSS